MSSCDSPPQLGPNTPTSAGPSTESGKGQCSVLREPSACGRGMHSVSQSQSGQSAVGGQ